MHLSFVAVFHTCFFLSSSFCLLFFFFCAFFSFFYIKMCSCVCLFFLLIFRWLFFSLFAYVLCCSTLSMHLLMRPDRASKPKNTKANSLRLEYMFVATPSIYYGQMNWEARQTAKRRESRQNQNKFILHTGTVVAHVYHLPLPIRF